MIYLLAFIVLWLTPGIVGYGASPPSPPVEQPDKMLIDHGLILVNNISNLYQDKKFWDVVLIVDGERLYAHRVVLASRSEYFGLLLYGNLQESLQPEVKINDATVTSFKVLLEYIYTGHMNLHDLEETTIVEIFNLANEYRLTELQHSISDYLCSNISVNNVCSLFNMSRFQQHEDLIVKSPDSLLNFIETHPSGVLQSEDVLSLSSGALQEILIRDTFYAKEIDIFRAVYRWMNGNQHYINSDAKNKVLSTVRYQLMSDKEFSEVWKSQLVSSDTISKAIILRNTGPPKKLQFRGQQNVNLVHGSQGTLDFTEIDGGAVVKLGHPTRINYISIRFGDKDSGNYSYYIDVSTDNAVWSRAIDYSDYTCRSTQRLWIRSQIVGFIRIVGTNNTIDKSLHFLKVLYDTKRWHLVKIKNGLVAPKFNVASSCMDPSVIEGESETWGPDSLFEQYSLYDLGFREFKFVWHEIKKGCIVVQLAQPYILSSIRMQLSKRSYDRVEYMYTVEASMNNKDWKMIADKSKQKTSDWQVLDFDAMPIVFIRITGVFSSDNFFRCIYFEAPSQDKFKRKRESCDN